MYYCPECGHFMIRRNRDGNPYENERTIMNMLQWLSIPLQHYRCECGNYLAGYIEVISQGDIDSGFETDEAYDAFYRLGDKQKEDNVFLFQDQVALFNEGGDIYKGQIVSNTGQFENLGEFAKWCYEDRLKRQFDGTLDKETAFNPAKVPM